MKQLRHLMGMLITVEVVDTKVCVSDINDVFSYFISIDNRFSTYKQTSEISQINKGFLTEAFYSREMTQVFTLCEKTKQETLGYFDIFHEGKYDPSGLVKGYAINNAAELLRKRSYKNFYIEAGGDIQTSGVNYKGNPWTVGIRSPFNLNENVKILSVTDKGVATSGTYMRGPHIYSPKYEGKLRDIVSVTVIGPNIYDADRFATAVFAMGYKGIFFLENQAGFEGYMIDKKGTATYTSNFPAYIAHI